MRQAYLHRINTQNSIDQWPSLLKSSERICVMVEYDRRRAAAKSPRGTGVPSRGEAIDRSAVGIIDGPCNK